MGFTKAISKTLVATPERQLEADADLDVVKKVQAGDVTAFDQLMLKYRERVTRSSTTFAPTGRMPPTSLKPRSSRPSNPSTGSKDKHRSSPGFIGSG